MWDIAKFIDHTLLKPDATLANIIDLCIEADENNFASICVNPCWIETAVNHLNHSNVKVCTVIGFPLGTNMTETKTKEVELALNAGADEIDVVVNIGRVKMLDEQYLFHEINTISNIALSYKAMLKIIIETSLLSDDEKVFVAKVAVSAGADFIKTSTGFSTDGAKINDIILLRQVVGENIGIKASGGIRSLSDAVSMINAGANRIGTSNGINIIKELIVRGDK